MWIGKIGFVGWLFSGLLFVAGNVVPHRVGSQEVPPHAYVATAQALAGELSPTQAVCVRPQFLVRGSPRMPAEIRDALEEEGWEFYDLALPADTGAVLLVFSIGVLRDGMVQMAAGVSGKYVSRAGTRVNTWTTTWRFDLRCPGRECSVEKKTHWEEMDGSLHDPEAFLAGNVGRCTGRVPGRR